MADSTKNEDKVQVVKLHHLRRPPVRRRPRSAWVVVRARRVRPPDVVPRAPRPVTRFVRASKVARCRCTCVCPSFAASAPNRVEFQPVNVGRIAELFPEGGVVSVEDLVAKGAVRGGRLVKVLGTGDVNVKLDITVDAWSGSAKEKIEAAGGSITAR